MDVQSLLFDRDAGWTESKAKAWAKSHGYKYGKVDTTDQYVRIRQFEPKGHKVKRTITFGRGIRAVVARKGGSVPSKPRPREESMATTTKEARRPRRRRTREQNAASTSTAEARRRRGRKAREQVAAKTAEASRRRRRRQVRETAPAVVAEARRPRRRRRRARASAAYMMEEARRPHRRRRRASEARRIPKYERSAAAKKGWKRRRHGREDSGVVYEARRTRRRRRARAATYEAPRRTRRRYHRRGMFEAKGGGGGAGAKIAQVAIAIVASGVGYILADGLDRFLATYDPSAAQKPKDKFTSDGAGTLANTLNIAQSPDLIRIGAGLGLTVVPAVGAAYIDHPLAKTALEGLAIGAGVKLFSTFWNNVVMGSWLKPKDQNVATLQKSIIARLYPAEVAAAFNLENTVTDAKGVIFGALSQGAQAGVGTPPQQAPIGVGDVGPFALSAESPYPDAVQALRRATGVQDFPTAAQAMGTGAAAYQSVQNVWGTGGYGEPDVGMGAIWELVCRLHPHVVKDAAHRVAASATQHAAAQAAAATQAAQHAAVAQQAAQQATTPAAKQVAEQVAASATQQAAQQAAVAQQATQQAAAVQKAAEQATTAAAAASPAAAAMPAPSGVVHGLNQPPTWEPGPPPEVGPGPQTSPHDEGAASCACLGDDNQFLGFIGDSEEDSLMTTRLSVVGKAVA
jgi:hypothetical protein